jgi:hypothetical protein
VGSQAASRRRLRIWFTIGVRRITQRSRTQYRACGSSCPSVLIGTKRILGRRTMHENNEGLRAHRAAYWGGVQYNPVAFNKRPKPAVLNLFFSSLTAEGQSNHQALWSGRWESNPTPLPSNLLNILASRPYTASNCVQFQRICQVRHRLLGDTALEMNVSERRSRTRMTELLLRDFRRVSCVHDETRDTVAERVKPATRNVECVEDRPKPKLDDIVARWWPTIPSGEEEAIRIGLPLLPVFPCMGGAGFQYRISEAAARGNNACRSRHSPQESLSS